MVSEPDELKLLSKSDEVIFPKIIDFSLNSTQSVKVSSAKTDDEIEIKTRTQSGRNSIFVTAFQEIRRNSQALSNVRSTFVMHKASRQIT